MSVNVLNQQKIDELSMEIGGDNVPVLLDIFLGEMDTYIENLSQFQGRLGDKKYFFKTKRINKSPHVQS